MSKPRGGLTKWFGENWVDISRPKKGGGFGDLYLVLYPVAPVGSDPALKELALSLERFYDPQGIRKDLRFE